MLLFHKCETYGYYCIDDIIIIISFYINKMSVMELFDEFHYKVLQIIKAEEEKNN